MSEDVFVIENHEDYPSIIVVISYLSLFSLAGTIGNAFVIYVFSKKRDKSTTTLFILVLAGTDLFTCMVIVPYTIYYEIVSKRVDNDTVCKIYQFLITSNVPFSAFIMVVIAFDRYFKICRPWNHVLDVHLAKKIVIGLLLFAGSLGIVTALTHGVKSDSGTTNATAMLLNEGLSSNHSYPLSNNLSGGMNYSQLTIITTLVPIERTVSFKVNGYTEGNYSTNTSAGREQRSICRVTDEYISSEIILAYQKFYASLYLISFTLVAILYSLIFRTIAFRRNQKTQRALLNGEVRRTSENINTPTHTCTVTTRLTASENGETEVQKSGQIPMTDFQRKRKDRNKSIRDKQRLANVKTAGILFIVTAVFIVAFLPAWLMAVRLVPPNIIIFYMYYSYNVANPIIYAFFNITFRKEMREVLNCR